MSNQVFISYSRKDQEFVFKLASDLEVRGGHVWLDQADIRGGEQWRQSLVSGIRDAIAFILVISPDAMESKYVAEEIEIAEELGKPVFPAIYRRAKIPQKLSRFQFIDFTHGGYQNNLTDLLTGLSVQGLQFQAAPELTPDELASRRRELMGAPVKVKWGVVLGKIPGWAFAWGIGWAIFWLIFPILAVIIGQGELPAGIVLLPLGGFIGGGMGGLLAGLVTMISLRHHATNIAWKHMKSAIRIWGLVGPIGAAIAFALAFLLTETVDVGSPECSNIVDCIGGAFVSGLVSGLATAIAAIIAFIFYSLIALLAIGAVAGVFAVRHIRRLEPGILGRQAIWMVIGWSISAPLAALASLVVISPFME